MVIYLTTNLINSKKYIGKDVNNNPKYLGSGSILKKAIKKHGKKNFKKEILEHCLSKEELWQREEYWLNFYNAESNPLFYNKTNKAYGNSGQTQNGKIKISNAKKGWVPSDETKKLMSENRKGHKMYNDEWRSKIKEALTGIKRSDETKQKQSKARKNKPSKSKKSVLQYDKQGNFLKEYPSAVEAAKSLNKKTGSAITEVCNGKGNRKSIFGYIWKYKN
jgi:group I intron endonuclease